ncbi:MAG: hypothetical protein H0X24_01560 [Ktedonobacterales bacterium]|nr:hypothetical protein [Ktedonobacterales bacterium]
MRIRLFLIIAALSLLLTACDANTDAGTISANQPTIATATQGFTVAADDYWGGEIVGKTFDTVTCLDVAHLTFRHVTSVIHPQFGVLYGLLTRTGAYSVLQFSPPLSGSTSLQVKYSTYAFCLDPVTPTIVP